jgi:hypothetical protein
LRALPFDGSANQSDYEQKETKETQEKRDSWKICVDFPGCPFLFVPFVSFCSKLFWLLLCRSAYFAVKDVFLGVGWG